jgi:ABC-type phosphate transport system ATPase subunit
MDAEPNQTPPAAPEGHAIEAASPKMRLSGLSLSLGKGSLLLDNICLTIPQGKIISLIGPSGSGKSTLLRCLNRLYEPELGTVFLGEVDITTLDVLSLRRRVGMLTQSGALFEGTVADNVAYGPRLAKRDLSAEQITNLLRLAGREPRLATKSTDTLSGGQAQRVALARTLANEPEVLLLDEPTSALDPAATLHVEETVMRLRDELGLTVVWVSHVLAQVERTADFVALLVDGRLVESGTPGHLLSGLHHHLTEDFAAGKLMSASQENQNA